MHRESGETAKAYSIVLNPKCKSYILDLVSHKSNLASLAMEHKHLNSIPNQVRFVLQLSIFLKKQKLIDF